jgi:uncharacterized protein (DUF488 family)
VAEVVDVRTVPASRFNPQFNSARLQKSLEAAGIRYEHRGELGGFRRPTGEPENAGWKNASFRGYADYMQTQEFRRAVRGLAALSKRRRIALMCAEAVPWRCHRSLIGDALIVRKLAVCDITGKGRPRLHRLTRFARVRGTVVTYPAEKHRGKP